MNWQPIETAPRIHPLNGGPNLLLRWNAPGIDEDVYVVGNWRNGWYSGAVKAYPTEWMYVPGTPEWQNTHQVIIDTLRDARLHLQLHNEEYHHITPDAVFAKIDATIKALHV